ncbi:MAG: ankyrin repeat domain-containing protein [Betaproteobacteria bacterium]|nr:ankyrin repeat domain-containing protein [Betaproteobacteria bacterium]
MNTEQEMQQVKGRIAEVYARRERLKRELETGGLAPRAGLARLAETDQELSALDSRFKQLWDAAQARAKAEPSPALAVWLAGQGLAHCHARTDTGMTPLMLAALKGERALLEELLALGADPNHVNDDDHHALWFACVHGDPALLALLIERGADIDNVNVNGVTCAVYAASTGKLDVLKCLVEAGADLSKETSGGYTALDSAATLPVLKYLRSLVVA